MEIQTIVWMWISIAGLTAMVMFLAVMFVRIKQDLIDVVADLFDKPEPVEYIQVIDDAHDTYIANVARELVHTHGIALLEDDIRTSFLFHYTTNAMVGDVPIEKCASGIANLIDQLLAEKENVQAEG